MKKLNRSNIGYEHNELDAAAKRLRRDGYYSAAEDYEGRSEEEQAVYVELNSLGEYVRSQAAADRRDSWRLGADLVDHLISHGWTPPEFLAARITEESTEGDTIK